MGTLAAWYSMLGNLNNVSKHFMYKSEHEKSVIFLLFMLTALFRAGVV